MRVNMVVHIYNDKELLLMKYILSVFIQITIGSFKIYFTSIL